MVRSLKGWYIELHNFHVGLESKDNAALPPKNMRIVNFGLLSSQST